MSAEWIVGINPVEAVLTEGAARVRELWLQRDADNPRLAALAELARRQDIAVELRPRAALERIAGGARHQGIAAQCVAAPLSDERSLPDLLAQAGRDALLLV
ncbi:RNA methyltransferase substrate-binding domain-containing protein, partial [Metallibacterium sp.]